MPELLRIERVATFKASPEQVFAAWTDPALLARWISPYYLTVLSVAADPTPGGQLRIDMQGAVEGQDISGRATGTYQEVAPGKRLRFTWTWRQDATGRSGEETVITADFAGRDDGTEVRLTHDRFLDRATWEGYAIGWGHCFEKLARLFENA